MAAGMLEALLLLWSCLIPQEGAPLAGTVGIWSGLTQSLSEKVVPHPTRKAFRSAANNEYPKHIHRHLQQVPVACL